LPGPLAADQKPVLGLPKYPFTFSLKDQPFRRQTKGGTVQIADSNNFNVAKTVASALVTVRPGGLREMHWHPNADEWLYVIKGKAQVTVFTAGPNAVTTNFGPGDIGYILRCNGHYIKNVGDSDLVFLEVFNSAYFADVSLSDWLTHTPPAMVAAQLKCRRSHDRIVAERQTRGHADLGLVPLKFAAREQPPRPTSFLVIMLRCHPRCRGRPALIPRTRLYDATRGGRRPACLHFGLAVDLLHQFGPAVDDRHHSVRFFGRQHRHDAGHAQIPQSLETVEILSEAE
jgi:oxalate decarboxylase/phosphoglucose isomerase-like protein (cupin superfamily)